MLCHRGPFSLPRLVVRAAFGLIFLTTSGMPLSSAQNPQIQGPPGQYPPNRPQPVAAQCQGALQHRASADARRRVTLNIDTQNPYSAGNGRQGLRGRIRYGLGGLNNWRTATYDCVVDVRANRVERATYTPRASSSGWPGGPRGPGYPGGPGPGVGSYPRVRVDTSLRGNLNGGSFGNVRITRGYVDSQGPRPPSRYEAAISISRITDWYSNRWVTDLPCKSPVRIAGRRVGRRRSDLLVIATKSS